MEKQLDCIAVSREVTYRGKPMTEWLICNGLGMGKWKWSFDITTIADSYDCKTFAKFTAEETPNSKIHSVKVSLQSDSSVL